MKKRILLLSALTLLLCLTSKAQSDDSDDLITPNHDTTIISGKSINIFNDTTNFVLSLSGSGAFGNNNVVRSSCSYAFGRRNRIERDLSNIFVVGSDDTVTASHSICLGRNIAVSSPGSFAMGRYISFDVTSPAFIIGEGLAQDAKLTTRVEDGLVVGFLSTKPTLTVTASPNDYDRMITDLTGRVSIGDVFPAAKLHIKSDEGEDAGLILEPRQPNSSTTFIQLRDNNHRISVGPSGLMQITAGNQDMKLIANNVSVKAAQFDVRMDGFPNLALTSRNDPTLYCNATVSGSSCQRLVHEASYALHFDNDGFWIRTAEDQHDRTEITNWHDALFVGVDSTVTLNGKVGINTDNTTTDYSLAVAGGVLANKVFIQSADDWPDYVFEPGYERMPLNELETYLETHRHLPDVPNAEEVEGRGYELGTMQAALLRKVEEMTLYVIELEKRIAELEGRSSGDTVRFTYDACGNRTGRTIEFSRMDEEDGGKGVEDPKKPESWYSELHDVLTGGEAFLFPNPTDGAFTLALTGDIPSGAKATLLTLTGAVVSQQTIIDTPMKFDLNSQPAGVYLLRLETDKETKTWKVVKRN